MSLEALSQVGMRGVVSVEFFHPYRTETPDLTELFDRFYPIRARFEGHPLLTVGVSPHSPYNVTPQAWQTLLDKVGSEVIIHTHLAENEMEIEWFQIGNSAVDQIHESILGKRFGPVSTGLTSVEMLRPFLSSQWIAAHGVLLSETDLQTLQQAGVGIAHCPRSNLCLSQQTISDLTAYQQAGLDIGLGTDSTFSTPNLDLRAEARTVQQLQGWSARQVFELMTSGSAHAIKRGHDLGQLRPGYKADVVLWQTPHTDIKDPYEAWLAEDTEPQWVLINGRTVLEKSW
jgi:5-methylthioadenosine/S-adenosylhomocysteine deaminase